MAKKPLFWTENTKSNHLKLMIFYQNNSEIIQDIVSIFFSFYQNPKIY